MTVQGRKIRIVTIAAAALTVAACSTSGPHRPAASSPATAPVTPVTPVTGASATAPASAGGPSPSVSARTVPLVRGTVVLHGLYVAASDGVGTTCETTGNLPPNKAGLKPIPSPYDDVKRGATVRVADPAGHPLGTARLGTGRAAKPAYPVDEYDVECDFPFTLRRVTVRTASLAVQVGRHSADAVADHLPTLRVIVGGA